MNSRERVQTVLSHKNADTIAVDFGSTAITGMHCKAVEGLRKHYGLEQHPVYVHEPYQMLGLIEDDLADALGLDCQGAVGAKTMFGSTITPWKEVRLPWGQVVMLPENMPMVEKGDRYYTFPEGDTSLEPCAMLPKSGYFFDAIERGPLEIDDSKLNVEDNLEEFSPLSDEDLAYWTKTVKDAASKGRAVVASFGGTALGDIALVPGMQLREPKGIRRIPEWYMSTIIREDYVKEIFRRQTEIALQNLEKLNDAVGELVDVAVICGTDFGTQTSQFCSEEQYRDMYLPYYRIINDWIHSHTGWKTFKHSCGAVRPLVEAFIDSGFDILNPVQISATGMEPAALKKDFGDRITFWGGGVDTQGVFAGGTPQQVAEQVRRQCEIFGENGGFVFNAIHNVQANVPIENVISMFETLKSIRNSH